MSSLSLSLSPSPPLSEKKYLEKKKKKALINKDVVGLALVGWQLAPEQKSLLAGFFFGGGVRFRGFCVFW